MENGLPIAKNDTTNIPSMPLERAITEKEMLTSREILLTNSFWRMIINPIYWKGGEEIDKGEILNYERGR
jgi:hypothetical protein